MKVKEYLVNRLVEVERDLEMSTKNYALLMKELKETNAHCEQLSDQLDQYEMEREHIKQIITCNIGRDAFNHLELNIDIGNNDFKTLLAILDIKPEDYSDNKDIIATCTSCIYQNLAANMHPCDCCTDNSEFVAKEDNNAKNTD